MTDESLWPTRREHARRFASGDLRGYPTLAAEDETETTLAAVPTKQAEKRPRASE
jgi:hypothetical protein